MQKKRLRIMTRGEYITRHNIECNSNICTQLFTRGSVYDGRHQHYICKDFDNDLHFDCVNCLKKPAVVAGKYIVSEN